MFQASKIRAATSHFPVFWMMRQKITLDLLEFPGYHKVPF